MLEKTSILDKVIKQNYRIFIDNLVGMGKREKKG